MHREETGKPSSEMNEPRMIDEFVHGGPEHLDPGFIAGFGPQAPYTQPYTLIARSSGLLATSPRAFRSF